MKLGVALMCCLICLNTAEAKNVHKDKSKKSRWIDNDDNALTSDGSGLGEEDDGYNDYEGSSDGSGELPIKKVTTSEKSSCLKLLETSSFHKMAGAFIPRCTFDGAFGPLQCHGVTGECWCSDREGRKIPGSVRKEPDMPKCKAVGKVKEDVSKKTKIDYKRTTKPKIFFEVQTNSELPRRMTAGTPKGSIIVDSVAANEKSSNEVLVPYKMLNNAGVDSKKYSKKNKDPIGSPPYYGLDEEAYSKYHLPASKTTLLMTQPGILAGIVCAGVVIVLCFVTFVTFIAYRLRRRSYYQAGEKSKTPPMTGGYVAGSGYGEIYGDGFRYQTPTKIPPWTAVDANGSLSYSLRHDREIYG